MAVSGDDHRFMIRTDPRHCLREVGACGGVAKRVYATGGSRAALETVRVAARGGRFGPRFYLGAIQASSPAKALATRQSPPLGAAD